MSEWFCEECQIPMTDQLREFNPMHSCPSESDEKRRPVVTDVNKSYPREGCNTCKGKQIGWPKDLRRAVAADGGDWDESDSENFEALLKEKYGEEFVDDGLKEIDPEGSRRGPSFWNTVSNFSRAMYDWSKKGFEVSSKEESERRLNICKSCPLYENLRCKHADCGCFVNAKARVATESCPVGKWEK